MRLFLTTAAFVVTACSPEGAEKATPVSPPTETVVSTDAAVPAEKASLAIEKLWVSEGFTDPEGVAQAPGGNYFISNVSGGGTDQDGTGWISILSKDGEILEKKWVKGLDAPKGMTVHEGVLYVADISRVRRYNIETKENIGDIVIDDALFLNDATVWQGGVYVSDSRQARIYSVSDEGAAIWLESEEMLGGVNGLLGDGDRMLVSTMSSGSLFSADANASLTEIATGMTDADGIGLVEGGGFMVSAWRGDIFYVAADGVVKKLADTREEEILQNDLTVFGDTIIVPNWTPGTVTAWRIKQ